MTLQQLSYFQHVARSGSFTRAARACFVSQTAISRQISALEEELHLTLIERDTTHVALTPAGEFFTKKSVPSFCIWSRLWRRRRASLRRRMLT